MTELLENPANTTYIDPTDPENWRFNLVLNPNYIFKGNLKVQGLNTRSTKQREAQIHLSQNDHKNTLSAKARKNITFALNWLYASAKTKYVWSERHRQTFSFKVNFITLTIPSKSGEIVHRSLVEAKIHENGKLLNNPSYSLFEQDLRKDVVDEKIFQRCINSFLTYMRKYHSLGNYVWKIEAQINGQLHIHLSTDQYIKYQDINIVWNRILQKNGLLDNHFAKFGNFNPPSTDVHSTKKMFNAIAYIGGYMAKDPNFCKQYNGRIWGCSCGLSPANKLRYEATVQEWKELKKEIISKGFEWKECIVRDKEDTPVASAGFLFYLKKNDCFNIVNPTIKRQYMKHREFIQSKTPKQKAEYMVLDLFGEENFISVENNIPGTLAENEEIKIIIPEQLTIFDEQNF